MSSTETILKLNNLTKRYGRQYAVKDLSFSIEKGNVYGILGPNGSGKSTTLGMVLNVVNPTSGSYEWFNNTMDTHNALKKVGAIIEHPNFYPNMSAYKNLQLVSKIKQCGYDNISNVLHTVELHDRQDDYFRTFSLGMKQRLAIASALLNKPEILILDEPTNGLDPKGIHQIRSIIQKIAATGTTILLASHLLDEVEKICSHVVVLRKGEKLYAGKVDEMNASYGFIETSSEDHSGLLNLLNEFDFISSISKNELTGIIKITLNKEISATDFNKLCFNKGIVLNHLLKRKESLEEQFLQLTK
jgi:ABC-2 type transport system ATP-binding protein